MSNETSKNNDPYKDCIIPMYDDFQLGFKIYKRRLYLKSKKGAKGIKSVEEAAKAMEIDIRDYIGIEKRKSGLNNEEGMRIRHILNDVEKVDKLASFLEMDPNRLRQWIMSSQRKIKKKLKDSCGHQVVTPESVMLMNQRELIRKAFTKRYCEYFDRDALDVDMVTALNNIEKYSQRITKLPFLPQPLFILLNAISEQKDFTLDLDKIRVFTGEDENLSDYIECCPLINASVLYAANAIFDPDAPKKSYKDCFKPMSLERLSMLLFVMIYKVGIYEFAKDLRQLQEYHEFHTLGLKMAKLLKPHLPSNVDYNVLQQALTLQGIGTNVLYNILAPSLSEEESTRACVSKEKHLQYNLTYSEMDLINHFYHPYVSAQVAFNWGYDEKVVNILLEHHSEDYSSVAPECACLKLINRFNDKDFRIENKDDIDLMINDFEQLKINRDDLFTVVCEMDRLKDEMIKASSSLIDVKSSQAKKVTQEKIKSFSGKVKESRMSGIIQIYEGDYTAKDFRFDPEYLLALKNECYLLINSLYENLLTRRDNEPYEKFEKRALNLQLAADVVMSSHDVVAKRLGVDVLELKNRLGRIL
ncbi:MAG: hypothetical protein HQM16_09265 [Deltaproteobacteria bacterium]|nr:hypothetical protein [Deltaproteobacteria bacterium]